MDAVWGGKSDGMKQVVGFGDRSWERSNWGDEFGARYCN